MAMNAEEWNEKYPPGTPVIYTPRDGEPVETVTETPAALVSWEPAVRIKGYPQPVWLHRVEPVVEGPEPWPRRYLVVPPDLYDGQTKTLHGQEDGPRVLGEMLLTWLRESGEGEEVTFSWKSMTEEEFNAVPEV